jgi:iron-sulfur cluster protein
MARKHENDSRGAVRSDPGGTERRDVRREIDAALADPILKEAMSRALATMHRRREAAIPSQEWFEERRERARAVKDEALDRQSELLAEFVRKASAAGAVVEQAADAAAACAYICDLARRRGVELVVKSKSMTTEEIDLAHALERTGVSVIETDLGERIIQLAGERPSHLVAPAIHKNKEEIIRLCSEKMTPVCPPTDAEGLTRLVRAELRDSFLKAAMGITGANFAVAETGSIVIVENEGNASLATLLPPIHVAVVGREKLIPRLADLAVFMELLPRSAAGQKMTGYVSILTGVQAAPLLGRPGAEREFHLVILDNGRSAALDDPGLREMLRCIRCGACLNACAPYSLVGGHVFGGDPYPGGIGCAWTYVTKGHAQARDFNGLCSTCSRCTEVCPVKIDIPWVNTLIHQRNNREFGTGMRERAFARTDLMGKSLSALAPLSNAALRSAIGRLGLAGVGVDGSRPLPRYERITFRDWWRHRVKESRVGRPTEATEVRRVALFVDCFTNHNLPQVGCAAVEVLEAADVEVTLLHNSCCGRGALSQGLLDKPRQWAAENIPILAEAISEGRDVLFIEPSCLSAVRDDYTRLLEGTSLAGEGLEGVQAHCYDITEYLVLRHRAGLLDLDLEALAREFVVHGHCHQKSLGLGSFPGDLVRLIPGVTVHEVEALCCGLVGSFGYKKEYAVLSRAIGAKLFEELARFPGDVVTCGISCRSQIEMGTGRRVLHPVEVLAGALGPRQPRRPMTRRVIEPGLDA